VFTRFEPPPGCRPPPSLAKRCRREATRARRRAAHYLINTLIRCTPSMVACGLLSPLRRSTDDNDTRGALFMRSEHFRAVVSFILFNLSLLATMVVIAQERDALSARDGARGDDDRGGPNADSTFTRMFPDLPPFAPQTDALRSALQELGRAGGLMDAFDNLSDPVRSITEPGAFSPSNPDNPSLAEGGNSTAGMTFLGQFLDHDVTLDLRSPLTRNSDPRRTTNSRTAAFDLDSLYGGGPFESPELYASDRITFRIEEIPGAAAVSRRGAPRFDLPRGADGTAIVGDHRNDENTIISQLHVAMLRFHNAVVARIQADPANAGMSPARVFALARRTVRWHYQWIIVHEFLPATIGEPLLAQLLRSGPRYYNAAQLGSRERERGDTRQAPRIPVEFSVAAYRFGHSQVRPSYRLNFGGDAAQGGAPFFAFVFDANSNASDPDPADLRGGKRAPRRFVDWQTFFNFGDGNVRPNKTIDIKLSTPLMTLPGSAALPTDGVQSLAARNLMRHVNFGLPSGQAIARRIGAPVLSEIDLQDLRPLDLEKSTPLWIYVLREAEVMERGRRLGPVGGRIVGEVFVGLLLADRESYLAAQPRWQPTLPSAEPNRFAMTDLLKFAGVVAPLE
jgi:hypothetical protein